MAQLGEFLVQMMTATAGAAAGAAGTAAAGPVAGAAAAVAATKVTGALLGSFVDLQDAQLQQLERLNQTLHGRLDNVDAGLARISNLIQGVTAAIGTQLDEPWKTAGLYLTHAAEPGQRRETRRDYLRKARDKLFEAHSLAGSDAMRGLIAQRLAAISLMLGDGPSARKWLFEAYPAAETLGRKAAAEVTKLFVIDWNVDTLTRIGLLKSLPTPGTVDPFRLYPSRDRRRYPGSPMSGVDKPDTTFLVRQVARLAKTAERSSAENFWVEFIKADASDRAGVVTCGLIRNKRLEDLAQIQALRRLYWMTDDLNKLGAACIELGATASSVPVRRLAIDLLPFRRPQVELLAVPTAGAARSTGPVGPAPRPAGDSG